MPEGNVLDRIRSQFRIQNIETAVWYGRAKLLDWHFVFRSVKTTRMTVALGICGSAHLPSIWSHPLLVTAKETNDLIWNIWKAHFHRVAELAAMCGSLSRYRLRTGHEYSNHPLPPPNFVSVGANYSNDLLKMKGTSTERGRDVHVNWVSWFMMYSCKLDVSI